MTYGVPLKGSVTLNGWILLVEHLFNSLLFLAIF